MTSNTSILVSEVPEVIVLTPLLQEALHLGAVINWDKYYSSQTGESPSSPGFITISVNSDKSKIPHLHLVTPDKLDWAIMIAQEHEQVKKFCEYRAELENKRVLVASLIDGKLAKLVKPSDASRYFKEGRRRIKGKIYKRLGRWFNQPGYLLSLTFDPSKISRADAWRNVGKLRSEFIDRVNRWRKRHGFSKAKCIPVLEVQPGTGYPHIHIVFPYLKYLAPIKWMTEQWGQADNSVDMSYKNSMSPVSYVCKYISKLEGWSDLALSYIWVNRTRLYSMSRDYVLPDFSGGHREPEWEFKRCFNTKSQAVRFTRESSKHGYDTLLGTDDLVNEIPEDNFSEWVREHIRKLRSL